MIYIVIVIVLVIIYLIMTYIRKNEELNKLIRTLAIVQRLDKEIYDLAIHCEEDNIVVSKFERKNI